MATPPSAIVLGILSDAHGDAEATARAADLLLARGATELVYLGDACADRVPDALAGLRTPAGAEVPTHLVAGNCDGDPQALRRYAQSIGLRFHHAPALLELGGKRLAIGHGHEPALWAQAQMWQADYLLHGHLHRRLDFTENGVRVICAGSVASPRDGLPPVAALLDLASGQLSWLELP